MQEPPIKHPLGQPQKSDMQLSPHFGDTAFRLQTSVGLHARPQLICSTTYIRYEVLSQFNSWQCFGYILIIIHHQRRSKAASDSTLKTVGYSRDIKYLYLTFLVYLHISGFLYLIFDVKYYSGWLKIKIGIVYLWSFMIIRNWSDLVIRVLETCRIGIRLTQWYSISVKNISCNHHIYTTSIISNRLVRIQTSDTTSSMHFENSSHEYMSWYHTAFMSMVNDTIDIQ